MNSKYSQILTGLLIIICISITNAQNRSFKEYSINEGLSQSVINCLYQDSEGFIWVGTQDGINRFDGYEFEVFTHNPADRNSISNNWIFGVAEDNQKNLWIATRNGLNKYNKKTNNFECYTADVQNGLHRNEVYGVCIDDKNNVWASTPPYLNRYNVNNESFVQFNSGLTSDGSIQDQSYPLFIDNNENIWMTSTTGVACFDQKQELFILADCLKPLAGIKVYSVENDIYGNIWIATENGLFRINSKSVLEKVKIVDGNTNQEILFFQSLIIDGEKNLWVGTNGNGLGIIQKKYLNKNNHQLIFYKANSDNGESLCNDNIHSLIIDASNNLWIGTLSGINRTDLKPSKFRLYRKADKLNSTDLLDNVIASLYKAEDGKVWIGNWGKGLNILDRVSGKVVHFTENSPYPYKICNNFVHVIFKYSDDNIWIGTRNGIQVFDKKKGVFVKLGAFYKHANLPDFEGIRVSKIIETNNVVYVATQNGLYELNMELGTFVHYTSSASENSLSDNLIYDIIQDKDQDFWLATSNGLTYYSKDGYFRKIFYTSENTNTLCDNAVVSLCEDNNGIIWIGTKNGVNAFNKTDSVFTYYSQNEGLPRSTIYEILEDDEKNLWFTTGSGLALLNRETNKFIVFGTDDGLQSMEFNLRASYKSPDGEVFLGGMNGFNSFYPTDLFENQYKPNTVLKTVEINFDEGKKREKLNSGDTITVPASVKAFTVEFSALEYTNPLKNRYKYQIEGIDDQWVDIGARRFVPFTKLQPGKYTFHVLGSNNDGVWGDHKASLKIFVKPPWWKSTIAMISYLVFIILGILFIIKYRERKIKFEKQVLEKEVQKRTIEVVKQKDEIEKSHKQIKHSINYAFRIQEAVLPNIDNFRRAFPESFVFFQPKDVVSGDFYWFKKFDKTKILAVADCTGHGVPGAFMSMLGISFLNEIVVKERNWQANLILNELRSRVKTTLKQEGKMGEAKDGMDIALVVIDEDKNEIQFSGAQNPLWLIKNEALKVVKGDKMPIGIHLKEKESFTNHIINYTKGERIYLFSDGYADQFGGEKGNKYGIRNFKEKIIEIQTSEVKEQKNLLSFNIERWMKDFKQLDDMVVVGIEL